MQVRNIITFWAVSSVWSHRELLRLLARRTITRKRFASSGGVRCLRYFTHRAGSGHKTYFRKRVGKKDPTHFFSMLAQLYEPRDSGRFSDSIHSFKEIASTREKRRYLLEGQPWKEMGDTVGRGERRGKRRRKKREDLLAANVCPFCHILAV